MKPNDFFKFSTLSCNLNTRKFPKFSRNKRKLNFIGIFTS